MDPLTEARRSALRRFVASEGGNSAVATKYKLKPSRLSYLSQLIAPNSKAPFGERSARNWQALLRMKHDPLLHPSPGDVGALPPDPAPPVEEIVARLGDILRAVPSDQREVIGSLLSAYARKPGARLAIALTTLLEGGSDEDEG